MQLSRSIETDPDQETILCEKLSPVAVKTDTISLKGVLDSHVWRGTFSLIVDGALEELQAHQSRLAAMPGKGNLRGFLGEHILACDFF